MTSLNSLCKQGKWFVGIDQCFINSFSVFPQQISCSCEWLRGKERTTQCLFTWPWLFFFVFITIAIFLSFFTEVFPEIFFPHAVIDRFSQFSSDAKIIIFTRNYFPIQRKLFTWSFRFSPDFHFMKRWTLIWKRMALDFHEIFRFFLDFKELSSYLEPFFSLQLWLFSFFLHITWDLKIGSRKLILNALHARCSVPTSFSIYWQLRAYSIIFFIKLLLTTRYFIGK